jgi:hypothetical protein
MDSSELRSSFCRMGLLYGFWMKVDQADGCILFFSDGTIFKPRCFDPANFFTWAHSEISDPRFEK